MMKRLKYRIVRTVPRADKDVYQLGGVISGLFSFSFSENHGTDG
jgi:hypothetical protein